MSDPHNHAMLGRRESGGVRWIGPRGLGVRRLRQAEVENLQDAVGRDLDVRGLEVPVDNVALVRGFDAVDQLPDEGDASSNVSGPRGLSPSTSSITR